MPNWCYNRITFKTKQDLEEALQLDLIHGQLNYDEEYSFEKHVPSKDAETREHFYTIWGTRSDLSEAQRIGPRILTFETAWNPPLEFYATLANKGFIFMVKWNEPGMRIKGQGWSNGKKFICIDK